MVQAVRARKLDAEFVTTPPAGAARSGVYSITLSQVTPDEALAVRRSGRVELTGRVGRFPGAGSSRCSVEAIRTEAPEPTLTSLVTCGVALRLETVRFVVPGRGQVRSWTAQPPAMMAKASPAPPIEQATPSPAPPFAAAMSLADTAPAVTPRATPSAAEADADTSAPAWLSAPNPELVERFYPLQAYGEGVGGQVTLNCLELEDGRVTDCAVTEESPLGAGFGRAALSLSRSFRFTPFLRNGRAERGRLRIPYNFSVTDDEPPISSLDGTGPQTRQAAPPQGVESLTASPSPPRVEREPSG